jgi:hypothetical protein
MQALSYTWPFEQITGKYSEVQKLGPGGGHPPPEAGTAAAAAVPGASTTAAGAGRRQDGAASPGVSDRAARARRWGPMALP